MLPYCGLFIKQIGKTILLNKLYCLRLSWQLQKLLHLHWHSSNCIWDFICIDTHYKSCAAISLSGLITQPVCINNYFHGRTFSPLRVDSKRLFKNIFPLVAIGGNLHPFFFLPLLSSSTTRLRGLHQFIVLIQSNFGDNIVLPSAFAWTVIAAFQYW